jgi:putative transposase
MKPKIKLKSYEKEINKMVKKINIHKNDIWYPDNKLKSKHIKVNTWFTITEQSSTKKVHFKENVYDVDEEETVMYHAKKVLLNLTLSQKNIINSWLNIYSKMYNISLKYIKNNIKNDKKVTNFMHLRSLLKKEKQELIQNSTITVHDTDYAIKLACQNYKSALTNYKNGNIKYFRIRYWKSNKDIKVMDMEKINFSKNGIRPKILGNVIGYYNGEKFKFETIKHNCRLQKYKGEYFLYVPELIIDNNNNKKKNKQITIDPGIRRFCTGITENKIVKIAENGSKCIEKYLKRKDNIMNNENINHNIKKKNECIINKKIHNLVNELHWKTIDYLTKNNNTILIGNMSSKSIVKKTGNLQNITKRIALSLRFFEFNQRLKYKCNVRKVKYGMINEWMTSKMCSLCGDINKTLGSGEIFKCNKCKMCMERDINGARNIHIKAIH